MDGEGKRHQMMQNLFGDQSEEEEEEEIDSEHESNRDPNYISDDGEGEADFEGEGETDVHRHEEVEIESEVEMHEVDSYHEESGGERVHSSQEKELSDQRIESEDKEADSDDREGESEEKEAESEEKEAESEEKEAESEEEEYGQRAVVSRREIIASGSERWDDNHYADNEDEEVAQSRTSRSPGIQKDHARVLPPVTEIHDVFGESDEDEPADYAAGNELEHDSHRSLMDEEGSYENDLRPEDIVPDQDAQSESEDETLEQKHKEKPMGPPLELDIPLCHPLGPLEKMNMIKVSNIMGIEPKPFDPKTYVEEDVFVTDESGGKKRIRLEDNIVRWRKIRNRDGTMSYESNARFVRWSDGSLQLLIGNEVLNISVQEAQHDQTHLFLRHAKGILQSQGRLLRKMRFMPSSLSSKSHRLLTALVDSRHKKVYKVQKCITEIDPEREKEEKEKAEGQTIRANELLNRKREKVSRKYAPPVDRGRQLSPGFLEDALEENDEHEDYYESQHSSARRRFEEDLEVEALSVKRILNAKRSRVPKDIPRKSFLPPVRPKRPIEFSGSEKEESEYESDEGERSPIHKQVEDPDEEYEEAYEHEAREGVSEEGSEGDDSEEPNSQKEPPVGNLKRKEIESDEDSPPRKPPAHRRMAVVYDSDEE